MKLFAFLFATLLLSSTSAPENGWPLFSTVKFETKFIKEQNDYFSVPTLNANIKAKEGAMIELRGYFMPSALPKNQVIISAHPFESCYFNDGIGGPESVAEILLKEEAPRMKLDQDFTVRGKLKFNHTDLDHLFFMLVDAEIVH